MMLLVVLTSLLAIRLANAARDLSNSPTKIAYSSPSEPHITKNIVIHGRPISVRPLFGRPTYVKPLRTGSKALAFANRQYRASSDGVYYQQQVPQYKNQPPPCTPVDTASYREGPHCQPPRRQYPLPQCYTNKSGFMCCNKRLESEMRTTFNQLKSSHKGTFQTCNTQKIANVMQENLQRSFNSTFETVAAIGDFASKIHFFSDHVCKLEIDGRYMLAYGTPRQALPPPPYNINPPQVPVYNGNVRSTEQYGGESSGPYMRRA
ncbi:hypothetical protein Tcan_12773 [Toxocara canis]|uniref:Ground-like domain-containing protein n=1 Tax=Toxocara canis TaxID=6265 RepID=A0A0B2VKB6_TOXCA|nr:hypothetical protein Tcan_12773 [Toxocara canis]